ncbi:helicase-related protein (plasmid) [Cyanobacterium sp. IPPAS B-1200]|uniref:helicase-related protein n=1 Tax=Cyanobacterium sp. IPPAS B-1200 TaxID=1562720 RepID=UPI0008524FCE|nr:helicase-related protein [Cyanobacterium sp. IPPAS B-1200]OEJ78414.1 hypothetical protein A5482_13275 [Cyanobacterium sp. IPPAS B-1200]
MVKNLIGKRISIPDQFTGTVLVEQVDVVDDTVLLQVKKEDGDRTEAMLELKRALELEAQEEAHNQPLVDAKRFFLFIESARIKTAYDFDPHFAVSLSGVRPLPHQLEAVYQRILPQTRLRFLLADDPGAGKTIMGGLLLKELKLRHAVERILILTPAPLTIQWQDELKSKFSETFEIITSFLVKNQLGGNPWERFRQCIASIDFAKRDDVLPSILQVDWDLVIIDEAHKCSARSQGDELRRTGRYRLAEELSKITERILLLTATPHQGDPDQFHNFLRLLDGDQFISNQVNPSILQLDDSPWFLRRIKEELRDFEGKKLFKQRNAKTVPFELSPTEKYLYDQVTEYINCYLGRTKGKKQGAVALARTVLQRRLASSLNAIYSSLKKREKRFTDLLEELQNLSTYEQHKRLLELGRINYGSMPNDDANNGFSSSRNSYTNNSAKNKTKNNYVVEDVLEDDDFTEDELEDFSVNATVAEQLDELEAELKDLKQLVRLAEQTIQKGQETKLNALKQCLNEAEFNELSSGDGKLLIFTEHRDTLSYLKENLTKWGYSVCEIHGGMNAIARKVAQKDFQFNKQICLATEAAGEGINLQFCHLMINYDIPWSPHRLEQRMGRIHRIGQTKDVYVFNFVAINTVEGNVLNKLLRKLEEIKAVMGDKVFDVIGQLLQVNNINFEDLIKDATYGKPYEEKAYETVEKLDPNKLKELEEATGIALATSHVDLSQVRKTKEQDFVSEERRLMPRYVEEFFARACEYLVIKLEVRADGLWRIPYLKEEFRSPLLDATRRLGIAEKEYKKFTFYKEKLEEVSYADAEFVSPGHPLFGAISERLDYKLAQTVGFQSALFSDADAVKPYRIHFYQVEITGEDIKGKPTIIRAVMKAVLEEVEGEYQLISTDCLHDLTPLDESAISANFGGGDNIGIRNGESEIGNNLRIKNSDLGFGNNIGNRDKGKNSQQVGNLDCNENGEKNRGNQSFGFSHNGNPQINDFWLDENVETENLDLEIEDNTAIGNSDLGIEHNTAIGNSDLGIGDNTAIGNQQKDRANLGMNTPANSQSQTFDSSLINSNSESPNSPFVTPTHSLLSPPTSEQQNIIEKWLKVKVQFPLKQEESQKRQRELKIRQDYLEQAMNSAIKEARSAHLKLASKVAKGDDTFRIARDNAKNKIDSLQERYNNKKNQLSYLQLVRPGKIIYQGTALVIPTPNTISGNMRSDEEVEAIAMEYVMNYERERGWIPTDVSQLRDGCGFDIRSVKNVEDDSNNVLVRRIEVKGRADFNQDICLTNNEWRRAQQLGDSYWLYVVWGCKTNAPQLITIQNPAVALAGNVKEVKQVTRYIIGGSTLAKYHHN